MNLRGYGFLVTLFFSFSLSAQPLMQTHVSGTSIEDHAVDSTEQQIALRLFEDSLRFYHREFRHASSGQYIDATSLREGSVQENNSSVAATGMGLIALALGDAAGITPEALPLAHKSLSQVLDSSYSRRHPQWGWFRHWFNASDGSDNGGSRGDGYSTIDTAILTAGAVLAGNYFQSTAGEAGRNFRELSDRLLQSVNWESAIADMNMGRIVLAYNLEDGQARGQTAKFNEYVVVACMGKLAEERRGRSGRMTQFWNSHFADPHRLPKKTYPVNGVQTSVLTDFPFHFLSSFAIQFSYYLCGSVNSNAGYVQYFKNAMQADRAWFSHQSVKRRFYWGSGAGEALNFRYSADAVSRNADLIVSPHIVAGFLAESPELMTDLSAMYLDRDCLYAKDGLEVLWRCSLRQPQVRLNRLQAIDFSSMFLGLATVHPKIGKEFFKTYSP